MVKKLVLAGLCLGMVMSIGCSSTKTYIIDVRGETEVTEMGLVENAINVDVNSPDFIDQFKALNISPNDRVLVYCQTGARADLAKEKIEELGYKRVESLGGIEDAVEKLQLPLVNQQQ